MLETINTIVAHWADYLVAALTIIGALTAILSVVGGLLPADSTVGTWCRVASADLRAFAAWLQTIGSVKPPPTALLLLLAIPLCLASTACAGSFEIAKVAGAQDRGVTRAQVSYGAGATAAPADPKRCQSLDETHMVWSSFAKAGAALTGGAGLSTIPADDQGARIGLAVGAVIVGAFTAAAITVADSSAESWSRECAAP